MTWTCFMSETSPEPGAMWFERIRPDRKYLGRPLSPEYVRDHEATRLPIVVMIPGRNTRGEIHGWPFCVDANASDSDHGWEVSGTPPQITVTPSIHAIGVYHGWITDGIISDGLL